MFLGKIIKKLRKQKKMTLVELSRQSGVQIATLSRMENSKMTGTLESHMNIAKALGIDLTDLYREVKTAAAPAPQPVTETSQVETFSYNEKASYEILTSRMLSKKMMPVVLRIEKDGRTNPEHNPAGSEKFIFVLEGNINVHIEGKAYPLSTNNTLYFDASVKHYFENTGAETAKVIVVTTPVAL